MQTLFGYLVVLAISAGLLTTGCGSIDTSSSPFEDHSSPDIWYANEGYDMTAYFAVGKAVKGSPELSLVWEGVTYIFSTQENRAAFVENPRKYIPRFESHCTYSLSKDAELPGDPTVFRTYRGRLYFFVNEDAAREFDRAPEKTLEAAEGIWREIKQ